MSAPDPFYVNHVVVDEFEWLSGGPESMPRAEARTFSRLGHTVAAVVTAGVLIFGPIAALSTIDDVGIGVSVDRVVVHIRGAGGLTESASIPAVHRLAADRFARLFKAVPELPAEDGDDPDYGL